MDKQQVIEDTFLETMLDVVGAGGVSVQQVTQAMPMNVWQQVVDNALVSAHLGVAGEVTVDEAEKILNDLINWNIEVATDPLVNGGKRLVSVDAIADNNQPEATPVVLPEPIGTVGAAPGTSGFALAVFEAARVPVGTNIYTEQQVRELLAAHGITQEKHSNDKEEQQWQ